MMLILTRMCVYWGSLEDWDVGCRKKKSIIISSQTGTEELIRLHGCGCGYVSFFVADMFALQGFYIIRVLFTVVSWLPVPLV